MKSKLNWVVFIVYLLVTGYTMARHEPWNDEVHSWNIAKASSSYGDLVANARYEGHPLLWYSVLWGITRVTHRVAGMQVAHWIIAGAVAFLILFHSPLPTVAKTLIPFGYYFLFEYAVLSRNYALGVLLALCICLVLRRDFRYRVPLYYALLFCLSGVHLLAVLLAASLHVYFLLLRHERRIKAGWVVAHALLGLLILSPSLFYIFPPSDSQENIHFLVHQWNTRQLTAIGGGPLWAFLPVAAWWNDHFWNQQFILEAKTAHPMLRLIYPFLSVGLLLIAVIILYKNKKCLALFLTNLVLSFFLAVSLFALDTARHSGYIYIAFIAAYWLYCYEIPPALGNRRLVGLLLALQVPGGIFAVAMDIQRPFSCIDRVAQLIGEVPPAFRLVTDYWTMEGISAFTDRPVYCIDLQRWATFVIWDRESIALQKNPSRYSAPLYGEMAREGGKPIYLISQNPPDILFELDPRLARSFHVLLVDEIEGAIEKGGDVYLYRIEPR